MGKFTNYLDTLQRFIDLHTNQFELLTEKRDKTIAELDSIEKDREKIFIQLHILLDYHKFVCKDGYNTIKFLNEANK